MQSMQSNIKNNCDYFKNLIIKSDTEKLRITEKEKVARHLTTCADCREYEETFQQIKQTAASKDELQLVPWETIFKNLQKQYSGRQKQSKKGINALLASIRGLLEYRIPVYQAVLAGLVVLMIYGNSLFPPVFSSKGKFDATDSLIVEASSINPESFAFAWRMVDSQKTGISVEEDSILTSLIVSIN